ncbi:hypothetical protein T484DRAFT_1846642 [Baffinella frigidus]|nr:hypothetical protein T484DRAFT_1846642 [Cryptophyta sp. CCMP2293]
MGRHYCTECGEPVFEHADCPACGELEVFLCGDCAVKVDCAVCGESCCVLCRDDPCEGCGLVICGAGVLGGKDVATGFGAEREGCISHHEKRPKLACGHPGCIQHEEEEEEEEEEISGANKGCTKCAEEQAKKERKAAAQKKRVSEEQLEVPDMKLVQKLLAGEPLHLLGEDIKSASLKAALHAWMRDPRGAAQGLGFKRKRA